MEFTTTQKTDPFTGLMVRVEGGTFKMGSPSSDQDAFGDEQPAHRVTISSYEIGKYPVTQKQWREIMDISPSYLEGKDLPVTSVSWDECQEFLKKLNKRTSMAYRLPTEAEWEFAARGGNLSKGYKYAGGDNIDEVGWYTENTGLTAYPVGQKKANELGLYDMSGNVWEWCEDLYADYTSEDQENPHGPVEGVSRVVRGGSWYSHPLFCRPASRFNFRPGIRARYLGFRLALQSVG